MSRDSTHRYLIAYDVPDDHRRTVIAKRLSAYGDRVQYSVFIVDAKPARIIRLRAILLRILDDAADSVLICDMGPLTADLTRRFENLGRMRPISDQHVVVF